MREHIFLRRFTWGPSLFIFVLRFIDKVSILEICVFVGLAPLEKDLFNTISNLKKIYARSENINSDTAQSQNYFRRWFLKSK